MRQELEQIIREAAQQELLPRFQQIGHSLKSDGSIVTEADLAMQQRMIEVLQQRWSQIPLLGEEMSVEEQQQLLDSNEGGLWLLDPLDGTSNYAAGIPYFSVSLALMLKGEVELAIIYDPLRDETFSAEKDRGAWLNGEMLTAPQASRPLKQGIALIDLKRLTPELAAKVASQPPYSSQRNLGSGALDWCYVATGRVDVYLHGGQKLWDYAAGQLILKEAGGHSSTLNNEPVLISDLRPRSVVAAADGMNYVEWHRFLTGGA
ncbi:MAG: inositol monophosphatase family protein [Chromatiales bacterium]|nr:inositol monophosphatase family protein [Chromatiales bacterium]